ncbi:type I restriction-modification system subunit M N-terminal domain-containing protein [Spiroplasma endosymbiont of Asaphidion curtum]|uniref:type I restriction-modification system subunit M N-terminal domain-containing protein n=1 Tax=Spiroplasma endosymbiont of Asaphidion curtum TaxID=3066281 RepID=UPI00313D6659
MSKEELFSKLWKACNDLRGKIVPSEYKYIILTIMFLKYASDTYNLKWQEIIKNKDKNFIDNLEFLGNQLLVVPHGYMWTDIVKHKNTGDIHTFIRLGT